MAETVVYEWVVEVLDEHGDIIDCHYWPEDQLHEADAQWAENRPADFALCRRVICDEHGDRDRQYLYRNSDRTWPIGGVMEGGAIVPKRIQL